MMKLASNETINKMCDLGIAVVDRTEGLSEHAVFMGVEMVPGTGLYAVLDFDHPNDAVDLDKGTIFPTAEVAREKVWSLDHPIKMALHPIPAKAALDNYAALLCNTVIDQLAMREVVAEAMPTINKLAA